VTGLQYVNPATNPVVRVQLDSKNKKIVITDNGRGMDWPGLQNFFVMRELLMFDSQPVLKAQLA
jgi:hypothetical protein